MAIETIAEICGLAMIAAATIRAAMAAIWFARRRRQSTRRDQQQIEEFRSQAAALFAQIDPGPNQLQHSWQGKREFQIIKRAHENLKGDICSFYLAPLDGAPIPSYRPGQFLTLELLIPGVAAPVRRCYSLSEYPSDPQNVYRISIKKLAPPPHALARTPSGLASGFFHDWLGDMDVVSAFPPAGSFCLDQTSNRPVVLIAGGVGITPLMAMLNWLAATRSSREIWLFYGLRDSSEHAFNDHLKAICHNLPNLRVVVCYSRPGRSCRKGIDYEVEGYVNVELMQHLLHARDYLFYLCGPPAMMESVTTGLRQWGVRDADISFESFGSATASAGALQMDPHSGLLDAVPTSGTPIFDIEFARSKKRVAWTKRCSTLLELAESCGVCANSSCRAGQCGTCKVALKDGEVDYICNPCAALEPGSCLLCIARPRTNLVLDL